MWSPANEPPGEPQLLTSDDAAAALARVDALHTALTQSVLEGGDLDRIAAEVAGVLGVGILVTSTDGRERAAGGMSPDLRAALGTAGLVDPTGPAARGARDRGGHPPRHRGAAGAPDRGRRGRPGPARVRGCGARRPGRRARAGAGSDRRRAGDHPRAGRGGGRGQVPRRLPPRRLPRPRRGPGLRARARRGLRLGPGPAGGGRVRRAGPVRPGGSTGVAAASPGVAGAVLAGLAAGDARPRGRHPERRLLLRGGDPAAGGRRRTWCPAR